MPTLERPVKEGSVRTYQAKVGLGFPDILASEVDADLDTIYAAWNGGAPPIGPAGGGYLQGTYPNPTIASQSISGSYTGSPNEIRQLSIWGDNDIANASISGPKLAPNAVVVQVVTANVAVNQNIDTTITSLLLFPALTTRGTIVIGFNAAVFVTAGPSAGGDVFMQWLEDSTDLGIIRSYVGNPSAGSLTVPIPPPALGRTPAAGSHTYQLRAWTSSTSVHVQTSNTPGYGWLVSLA
jgi:hypothetical protein